LNKGKYFPKDFFLLLSLIPLRSYFKTLKFALNEHILEPYEAFFPISGTDIFAFFRSRCGASGRTRNGSCGGAWRSI
jgi:hypothetical protein